jgi:cell pole-organizing protein PopZ
MEEILASIRRIISDDEANAAPQPQPVAAVDYGRDIRAEEADDEAADTQIIDDIARVLSGAAAPAGGDDDILDLTELGVMSEVASEPQDGAPADELILLSEEAVLETEEVYVVRDFAAAFPSADPAYAEPPQSMDEPLPSLDEPFQSVSEPFQSVSEPPQSFAEAPVAAPAFSSGMASAMEDPTSALERAIAALKAGDLSAFAREAQFSDFSLEAAAPISPVPVAEPPLPEPEPEAVSLALEEEDILALDEPVLLDEPAIMLDEPVPLDEFVMLDEPELMVEPAPAWAAETPAWPKSESLPEPDAAPPPWRSEELSWGASANLNPTPPPQPRARKVNGGSAHKALDFEAAMSSKSLEDSVKEMLRPLLRQWLDENMPRVLGAALRDELDNSEADRRSR